MKINLTMIRIEVPHFVAGVVLRNGRVVRAAPILQYMMGWRQPRITEYCYKKGWKHDDND